MYATRITKNKEHCSLSAQQQIDAILASKRMQPRTSPVYLSCNAWGTHTAVKYRPGVIIRADNICTKTRPAIVIDVAPSSYTILPILTHNGNGLTNKRPQFKDEYLGLCDHREGGWYIPQNDMQALLTKDMRGHLLRPMSTVHFTEPVVLQYDQRTVIHGQLWERSTQTLLEHYRGPPSKT